MPGVRLGPLSRSGSRRSQTPIPCLSCLRHGMVLPASHLFQLRIDCRPFLYEVDGDAGEVKAEACDRCRIYLKLFYLEAAPSSEPIADDVATLALDLLMSEQGYSRPAANPFLLSRSE